MSAFLWYAFALSLKKETKKKVKKKKKEGGVKWSRTTQQHLQQLTQEILGLSQDLGEV